VVKNLPSTLPVLLSFDRSEPVSSAAFSHNRVERSSFGTTTVGSYIFELVEITSTSEHDFAQMTSSAVVRTDKVYCYRNFRTQVLGDAV
jgi:hypothetical protein